MNKFLYQCYWAQLKEVFQYLTVMKKGIPIVAILGAVITTIRGDQTVKCDPKRDYKAPHEESQQLYYHCRFGVSTLKACPTEMILSENLEKCVKPVRGKSPVVPDNSIKCDPKRDYKAPHEESQQLYYHCRFGVPILKACPAEMILSEESEKCVKPVRRKSTVVPDNPIKCDPKRDYKAPSEESQQLYYHCHFGTSTLKACPVEMVLSEKLEKCVKPSRRNSREVPDNTFKCDPERDYKAPYEQSRQSYYHCHFGILTLYACPAKKIFSLKLEKCVKARRRNGNEAPDNTFNCDPERDYKAPSEESLQLYYHCHFGIKTLKACPVEMIWSEKLEKCVEPRTTNSYEIPDIKCDPDRDYKAPYEHSRQLYYHCHFGLITLYACPVQKMFSLKLEKCVKPRRKNSTKVPDNTFKCDPERDYKAPSEESQQLYYHCHFGTSTLKACPVEMIWSEKLEKCVEPRTTNSSEIPDNIKCDPERDYKAPYEHSRQLYYHCHFGVITLYACPVHKIFSLKLKKCVKARKRNRTKVPDNTFKCDPERDYKAPSEESQQLYYHCHFGTSTLKACPVEMIWSEKLEKCVEPSRRNSTEVLDNTIKCDPDRDYKAPYEHSRQLYYHCHFGVITLYACPVHKIFSLKLERCVKARTRNRTEVPDSTINCDPERDYKAPYEHSRQLYYHCHYGIITLYACPVHKIFSLKLEKCVKARRKNRTEKPDNITKCDPEGDYKAPHEQSRQLYYHCHFGVSTLKACPVEMTFRKKSEKCVKARRRNYRAVHDNIFKCDPERDYKAPHEQSRQLYYHCHYGISTLQACPVELIFSMKLQTCAKARRISASSID